MSTNIKFVTLEDEAEGFFDMNGNIICAWHANDACWRHEYFAPLLDYFDVKVFHDDTNKLQKALRKQFS